MRVLSAMSVVFVVACSSEQRAPAPNVPRSVSEPEVRDESSVAPATPPAPPTPPSLGADAIVLSEPAKMPEPQYLAPRGRVKGKALRADRVVLHDDGADGQRLDLLHGPMAAGVCEPAGREVTLVSVQALSASLFVLGEERTGAIVAVNLEPGLDHSDFLTGGVRTRAKLTRLDVATRVAEGELSVTGPEGTSFSGRFVAAYCPHGRADPMPRPRVHAVEWDPDASPEASALPRGPAAGVLLGERFVAAAASLLDMQPEGWSIVLWPEVPADPCDLHAASYGASALVVPLGGPPAPGRERRVLRAELPRDGPEPPPGRWTRREGPIRKVLGASVVSLRMDTGDAGRLYLAFEDTDRSLVVGSFQARVCGR